MKLEGRVAFVTGAGPRASGAQPTRRFAAGGARVGILDLRDDQAKRARRETEEAGG